VKLVLEIMLPGMNDPVKLVLLVLLCLLGIMLLLFSSPLFPFSLSYKLSVARPDKTKNPLMSMYVGQYDDFSPFLHQSFIRAREKTTTSTLQWNRVRE